MPVTSEAETPVAVVAMGPVPMSFCESDGTADLLQKVWLRDCVCDTACVCVCVRVRECVNGGVRVGMHGHVCACKRVCVGAESC